MNPAMDRLAARLLGAALAVAACDPQAAAHGPLVRVVLTAAAAGAAWWAAPMVDERPVQTSMRWYAVAARRRGTLLPAAAVLVAARTAPPAWLAACTAGLLLAYLLATDAWTAGVTAPREARTTGPALAAAAATAIVFLAAEAPVAGTSWARLPAALAVAAAGGCLVLALRHRRADR